jgi:hypothetical protein
MLRVVSSWADFLAVFRSPALRRVVLAFGGFNVAEYARWIAILVYAFQRGGAPEAGFVALLQLAPAALVAPIGATLGDRYPRDRVLRLSYLGQALPMALGAVVLLADGPAAVVYALAIVSTVAMTLTRPAHGSFLPSLAREPGELTASYAASGTLDSMGLLVGPAVGGVLLQVAGPGAVLAAGAVVMSLAVLLVTGGRDADPVTADRSISEGSTQRAAVPALAGGFVALARLRGPRTVVILLGAAAALWGALDVIMVVIALDLAGMGESGVGFLNSAVGLGGMAGAAIALTLVGRLHLAVPFLAALLAWGLPLVVMGVMPVPIVVLPLLVVAGAGRSLLDVTGRMLLQRSTPDEVLSRVFGVLEGMFLGSFALGSVAIPVVIGVAGSREAIVIAGLWLPLAALVGWRSVRAIDRTAVLHVPELALLHGLPMFGSLAPQTLERLASLLVPVAASSGSWLIREGEAGDRFYIVASGELDVHIGERHVRTLGRGEGFGEIALLRDVPRTASVRARTNVELYALERDDFLAGVTGHPASHHAAQAHVDEQLGIA